jgi:formylglycine-generating enzyme required for sulfatase activity
VRDDVMAATHGEQQPFLYQSLPRQELFLVPPAVAAPAVAPPAPAPADAAALAWAAAKDTTSTKVLEEFIRRYGDSFYAELARARLEELKKSQVAVVAPPAGPPSPTGPCGTGPVTASLSARAARPLSASEECMLKPKDAFRECDKCPEMVVVPAGSFTMGSPPGELARDNDEGPQRLVTIRRSFAVGRFAVTFDEWDACAADGGCGGHRPSDQGWGRGRRPVIHVSWDDAKAYVAWLSRLTGKSYRLLSEAEHEYVTRAGTSTPFWFGNSISVEQANFGGADAYSSSSTGFRKQTVPVGSFQLNPWGLDQVHGNVREWTEDCYNASYAGAPADGSPWLTGDCNRRVLRNGSWVNRAAILRSAFRGNIGSTDLHSDTIGFRVARSILAP